MNRRQFVSGVGAATIVTGIGGCTPSTKDEGSDASHPIVTPTPAPTPSATPLPPEDIKRASKRLMIFMLAVSQRDKDGSNLIDRFFPADGTEPTDADYKNSHMAKELGVDPSEIKIVVQKVRASIQGNDVQRNMIIRGQLDAVRQMYDAAFAYGKPDCPSPTALKAIIAVANVQNKP